MPTPSHLVGVALHQLRDQPWCRQAVDDLQAGLGGGHRVELKLFDPEGDAEKQRALLEEFLSARPSALVVLPVDPALIRPTLRRYRAAGVPVIVLDNDVGEAGPQDVLIVADNVQFGRSLGALFLEVSGGRADLVEVSGSRDTQACRDRAKGFREAIAGSAVRIVDSVDGRWLASVAHDALARLLPKRSRLDGVFAHNDEMACGAWHAAQEAGRQEELLITGIDAMRGDRGLQMLIQGHLAATMMNPSPGPAAAEALLAILRHEPYLKRTVRRTALLRSNERIRSWQQARRA